MNKWPTFDDNDRYDAGSSNRKKNGKTLTAASTKTVVYIPENNYKKNRKDKEQDHIEDVKRKKKEKRIIELEDVKKRKELFKDLKTQVQSLGATQFRGWDKRDWIKNKEKNMGMKLQKNQKIPRKIMNGIKKKQNEKIKRREKEAKEGDVVLGKYKKKRKGGRFDMKKRKKVSRR